MREAARALDDVSDHLGEVLRHADALLAEWSRFGAQVRTQVDHEVAAIGEVVDGAVVRAASAGIDRAIADRLRALTTEIDRLEQRTRAASRAVADHRDADRRVLWAVVAGIVLANALLVALLLRKPEPLPVAEPVRMEAAPAQPAPATPDPTVQAAGPTAGSAEGAGANAGSAVDSASPTVTSVAGASAANATPGATAGSSAATKPSGDAKPAAAAKSPVDAAAGKSGGAAISLPPKAGAARTHKKW